MDGLDPAAAATLAGLDPDSAAICLDRVIDLLGDAVFADIAAGVAPRLAAALKSLPLADGGGGSPADDAALASALLDQVAGLQAADAQAGGRPDDDAAAATAEADAAAGRGDVRQAAVLRYRAERAGLLQAAAAVLRLVAAAGSKA